MAREQAREQREQKQLLDQWSQIATSTFDLLRELGDINASLLGRFSRQQLDFLSASIEAGTRQLQLLAWPSGDYRYLLDRESSLLIDYNTKFLEIATESTNIVADATERFAHWVQRSATTLEGNARSAARGVERAAVRSAERAQEGVERATRFTERAVVRSIERERTGLADLNEAELGVSNGDEPTLEVIPREDGWAVQVAGASRATSVHATKEEAVERARALAADRAPSQLVVHKKDGTVQDTITYPA
jgi:Uncharacterized protein conserved in bacteria (DUF2188)/Phasin protein